jgi:hypothetical protein
MKNHMAFKFLAFALCVVMLALALASGFLIVQASRLQIYETDDVQQLLPNVQDDALETAAQWIAGRYVEQTFSNLTGSFAERELQYSEIPLWMNNYIGAYTVIDTGGNMVAIKYSSEQASLLQSVWNVSVEYPVMAKTRVEADARFGTNYLDEYFLNANKEDIIAPGDSSDAEQDEEWMLVRHYRSDVYTVILYLQPDVAFVQDGDRSEVIAADRERYSRQIAALYQRFGFRITEVRGDYQTRYETAVRLVDEMLRGGS